MELRLSQALMIAEAFNAGGGFFAAPVGEGKTIPSMLIPEVVEAKRPILLIPAGLREKTLSDRTELARHWRVHAGLRLVNYELLQSPNSIDLLDKLAPDWVLADEIQALKNLDAARTRRFFRYLREHPHVRVVAFTGTPTRTRLEDYAHLMVLCLGEGAPVPMIESVTEEWGAALNARLEPFQRIHPGALLEFCDGTEEGNPTARAQQGFQKRLTETRGVLAFTASSCDKPLTLSLREPPPMPRIIAQSLAALRETWTDPNGDEFDSALELHRVARQLACGFYSLWDPPPSDRWLGARKDWHRFVREMIARGDHTMDSPYHVAARFVEHPLHMRWVAVRDEYKPEDNTVPVWLDDWLCRDAADWLRKGEPGIAWVEHLAVGHKIAEHARCRFFAAGERDARDIRTAKGPYVASIHAHAKGRNLQHLSRNLFVSCPPSGDVWEQALGRTHRAGQAEAVSAEVYLHTQELLAGLARAFDDAQYTNNTWGAEQKLLLAHRNFSLEELRHG